MKFYVASLLFGILLLIFILSSRNHVSISDPAKIVTPTIAQELSPDPKNNPAFQRSNHLKQLHNIRVRAHFYKRLAMTILPKTKAKSLCIELNDSHIWFITIWSMAF